METIELYLNDPSALKAEGSILARGNDTNGSYIVLDQTPAYAQGGGQEGSKGQLITAQGTFALLGTKRVDGQIRHYLAAGDLAAITGQKVEILIDGPQRREHSILHTAGHLIACLVNLLHPALQPVKGHHFADGSYVEFSGDPAVSLLEIEQFLKASLVMELKSDKKVYSEIVSGKENLNSPYIPANLPKDRTLRLVTIESYPPMPCGGIHVNSLNEIPGIGISKLKWSKGVLRISYSCVSTL